MQTAINAAGGLLPKDLPNPPTYRKDNPADRAVLIYAVYSDALPIYKVDDYAYTILAQKLSAVTGVSQVTSRASRTTPRESRSIRWRSPRAAIGLEDVRTALATATLDQPKGNLESAHQTFTLDTNDQLFDAAPTAR